MISNTIIKEISASRNPPAPSIQRKIPKKFPVPSQREIIINKSKVNQQLIKKTQATKWKWLQGDTRLSANTSPFKLLTRAMKSDKKMEKFELVIDELCQISDQGMSSLSQALTQMPCLKSLKVSFSGDLQITERGFSWLSESLKRMPNLQNLSLSFFTP